MLTGIQGLTKCAGHKHGLETNKEVSTTMVPRCVVVWCVGHICYSLFEVLIDVDIADNVSPTVRACMQEGGLPPA